MITSKRDIAKWNYATHQYEPYHPPIDAKLILYTPDMDQPINCANCLKDMTFGDSYTSHQYQNHIGFGYPVCEECYWAESELRREGVQQ